MINDYTFNSCHGLTSIEIPSSVLSIGVSAFANCYGLISVTIPSSVTKIYNYAFDRCRGLKSVEIPESITEIGYMAFGTCDGLKSVIYNTARPIEGNPYAFSCNYMVSKGGSAYDNAVLYVAVGGIENAQNTVPWSNFASIKELPTSEIEDVDANASIDYSAPVQVYNMHGVLIGTSIEGLPSGTYIFRQGAKTTKIAIRL